MREESAAKIAYALPTKVNGEDRVINYIYGGRSFGLTNGSIDNFYTTPEQFADLDKFRLGYTTTHNSMEIRLYKILAYANAERARYDRLLVDAVYTKPQSGVADPMAQLKNARDRLVETRLVESFRSLCNIELVLCHSLILG